MSLVWSASSQVHDGLILSPVSSTYPASWFPQAQFWPHDFPTSPIHAESLAPSRFFSVIQEIQIASPVPMIPISIKIIIINCFQSLIAGSSLRRLKTNKHQLTFWLDAVCILIKSYVLEITIRDWLICNLMSEAASKLGRQHTISIANDSILLVITDNTRNPSTL